MQTESGGACGRQPADRFVDGLARGADQKEVDRKRERADEFGSERYSLDCGRGLQESKHASCNLPPWDEASQILSLSGGHLLLARDLM
jgi:hypothetical protein